METITVADFSDILCNPINKENLRLERTLKTTPLHYRDLTPEEKDVTILEILKILQEPLPVSGPKRHADWEKGWDENYQALKASGEISALLPRYYFSGKNNIMRYSGKYIRPENTSFEIGFLSAIQAWLCDNIFEDYSEIFEYGCGPLQNVAAFAKEFPSKRIVGFDWAEASQRIANHLAENFLPNVEGYNFDIFNPECKVAPSVKTAVLTFGSLEQVGSNFRPFLNYLNKNRPGIVVNIEPFTELYNSETLFSHLGLQYAKKRNYLSGLYDELKAMASRNEIEILGTKTMLGNKLHDGWTFVIWRHTSTC